MFRIDNGIIVAGIIIVIESGVIRAVGKRGQPVITALLQLDKLSQAVSYFMPLNHISRRALPTIQEKPNHPVGAQPSGR